MANIDQTLTAALVIIGDQAASIAERLPRALSVMRDAHHPLKGTDTTTGGQGGPSSDISDPTGDQATAAAGDQRNARHDIRRTGALIRDALDDLRRLDAIVTTYAPTADAEALQRGDTGGAPITGNDVWCDNHAKHGHEEVRGPGRRNCLWCDKTKARYGTHPTAALIDAYGRRRLSDADYKRLLKVK